MRHQSAIGSRLVALLLACAGVTTCAKISFAQDYFLTFGGGPNPQFNQVSLEKNVQYYQKVLTDLGFKNVPHDIYFADGGTQLHAVKFQIPPGADGDSDLSLANLFSNPEDMATRFRSTLLRHLAGPATATSLNNWFDTTGKSFQPQDHLYFYFTGHGNGGTDVGHVNTTMDLWASPPEHMRDFVKQLDKLNPGSDVTLFMVQCHSGGFANIIYTDADPKKGLSPQHRIGFFSTTFSRLAAGCTPVMNEEEYRDFSTFFFAALCGKTRTGRQVVKPDYDKKGFTSYNDAFSYVLINDDTINIPVISSDQFLSDFSRNRAAKDSAELLDMKSPYATILQAATPAQSVVLEALSSQLRLTGDDRVVKAQELAAQIDRDRRPLQQNARTREQAIFKVKATLIQAVTSRFPELSNPWREDAQATLRTQLSTVRDFATSQPAYKQLNDAVEARDQAIAKDYAMELKWVVTQRLLNRAQSVVFAANLGKVAKPDVQAQYLDLVKRENSAFQPAESRRVQG